MTDKISFLRNGQPITLQLPEPTLMLMDYLRVEIGQTGTKEGCREGDCGACTVVVGESVDGTLTYRPVNSCIYLLGMLDGKELVTVEDLTNDSADLHPVQDALVRHHASQCGFCTPGFVMSLFALYQDDRPVTAHSINNALSGNLCRCTGYRSIRAAAAEVCKTKPSDSFSKKCNTTIAQLSTLSRSAEDLFIGDSTHFFAAPASLASLANLLLKHPDATLVAGATDVGLWITKQFRPLPKIISLGRIAALKRIESKESGVLVGAGATYAEANEALCSLHPDVGNILRRIGSKQVRASGTIGGNIANGSPIGDMPPMLIALDAELVLNSKAGERRMPLEDFFISYGQQDLQQGEFVEAIRIPRLDPDQHFSSCKISKRYDQDITAVLGAFSYTVRDNVIVDARIAYGGMAEIPKRAVHTEAQLIGTKLRVPNLNELTSCLSHDFTPLTDMRASAKYRLEAAMGLLVRSLAELSGRPLQETRVFSKNEISHV